MRKYAKAIVAVIGATLVAVSQVYAGIEWLPIAIAFVSALGVYLVPNLPGEDAVFEKEEYEE